MPEKINWTLNFQVVGGSKDIGILCHDRWALQ